MKMFTSELKKMLEIHKKGEVCADLRWTDFHGADLRWENLCGADLHGTDFHGADLRWANLRGADLREANLHGANLHGANLRGSDLCEANLHGADLSAADLRGADLRGADLYGTDLYGTDLHGVDLYGAKNPPFIPMTCPDTGEFTAWKRVGKYIVRLLIPDNARRCSAAWRKCRCDMAITIAIENLDGTESGLTEVASSYDGTFIYRVGEIAKVDDYDPDRWNECTAGIHFFINRQEAAEYLRR